MKYDHSFSMKNEGWLLCSRHSLHESRQSKRPFFPSTFFTPGVVLLGIEAEVVRPDAVVPVVLEAGQRARLLAHVVLGVAAVGAEREQLHQLARVVLVRRLLRVLGAREPQQHRRVARDAHQQLVERAQRVLAEQLVLVQHQPLRADPVVGGREPVVPHERHALDQRPVGPDHAVEPPQVVVAPGVGGRQRAAVVVLGRGSGQLLLRAAA